MARTERSVIYILQEKEVSPTSKSLTSAWDHLGAMLCQPGSHKKYVTPSNLVIQGSRHKRVIYEEVGRV